MKARKKLKPGQDGTKSLLDKYGEQLFCVRYRYDEERGLRHKTIELIVESTPWRPRHPEIPGETIIGVKVGLQEVELQTAVRQAGGKWNRELQLLELRYDKAVALDLISRIEPSTMPNNGKNDLPNSRQANLSTIRRKRLL
ncbi:MAG TPA: hypothetical protein PLD20_26125 [Blastocatellia bacterium]|nr:hypothetical protein [Blastocatellia bacterium]HMV87523.1 hypothetical protein [Blastocatellia bacterium]HMY75920.1 hypothetical protein [Blastocatellia bacterium]HMZ21437.1 hypothetical protein [Blastocatellia bacterium]HNG32251.1 hypothetical protein [Blastocatellia bacterium]